MLLNEQEGLLVDKNHNYGYVPANFVKTANVALDLNSDIPNIGDYGVFVDKGFCTEPMTIDTMIKVGEYITYEGHTFEGNIITITQLGHDKIDINNNAFEKNASFIPKRATFLKLNNVIDSPELVKVAHLSHAPDYIGHATVLNG
jgi:hypothetical protein